jgi:hypothetical protein
MLKSFFSDHRVRHQLAQLIELSIGVLESFDKKESNKPVALLKTKSDFWNGILNELFEIALASKPILNSVERVKRLIEFDSKKNQGFYVDFRDRLLIPQIEITKTEFIETKVVVERIFRFYKGLKILFHPNIENHYKEENIEILKNQLRVFIDEALKNYSFEKNKL